MSGCWTKHQMGGFWKHKEGTSDNSEVLLRPTAAGTLDKALLLQPPSLQQENSLEKSSGCPLGALGGKARGTGLGSYLHHGPPFKTPGRLRRSKCTSSRPVGWVFPGEPTQPTEQPVCSALIPCLFGVSPPSMLASPTLKTTFLLESSHLPTREAPSLDHIPLNVLSLRRPPLPVRPLSIKGVRFLHAFEPCLL